MAELASGSTDPAQPASESEGAPWLPDRVKRALTKAIDFASFKRATFTFLHLFAGKNDVLGKAVQAEAARAGIQAEVRAVDWTGHMKENLLAHEPYLGLCEQAKAGDWDAGHAGPPCGTFSAKAFRLRNFPKRECCVGGVCLTGPPSPEQVLLF